MRFRILVLLVILPGLPIKAQVFLDKVRALSIDSLKRELSIAIDERKQLDIFIRLSSIYLFANPDTAILYAYKGLAIARKYELKELECELFRSIGTSHRILGNTSKALELYLRALRIAEQRNLTRDIGIIHLLLGIIQEQNGNVRQAVQLHRRAIELLDSVRELTFGTISRRYLAHDYLALNKLDSAMEICQVALSMMKKYHLEAMAIPNLMYTELGMIWQAKKQYDSAIANFRHGATMAKDTRGLIENYTATSKLFQEMGLRDSSIVYATKTFQIARAGNFYLNMAEASSQLADLYRDINKDSLVAYREWQLAAKDSLFKMNQAIAFESITGFDETERNYEIESAQKEYESRIRTGALLGGTLVLGLTTFFLYRNNRNKQRAKQNIEKAYEQLKATQSQLIQTEKMASLGELTAGIAHEIQNPLNFVNNFSEVNSELIDELKKELAVGNRQLAEELADDIKENETKINHHGKRADAIVKGMLQHSQKSTGQKEPTDINALCDEYLRLSYHGLRAKDQSFNARFETDFDSSLPKINVVPQDIGRVILNLINNAFYAVNERLRQAQLDSSYEPLVVVSTKNLGDKIQISVKDNGNGIPGAIKEKIFQPFFTTKPTGQGTGLGLSLSYDIVKTHGGEITLMSKDGEGSEFSVILPLS